MPTVDGRHRRMHASNDHGRKRCAAKRGARFCTVRPRCSLCTWGTAYKCKTLLTVKITSRTERSGTAEEARELLDGTDILALRIGHEPAHVHVIEQALAQRADGLLAHWGSA
jgi:hypothetical protein